MVQHTNLHSYCWWRVEHPTSFGGRCSSALRTGPLKRYSNGQCDRVRAVQHTIRSSQIRTFMRGRAVCQVSKTSLRFEEELRYQSSIMRSTNRAVFYVCNQTACSIWPALIRTVTAVPDCGRLCRREPVTTRIGYDGTFVRALFYL